MPRDRTAALDATPGGGDAGGRGAAGGGRRGTRHDLRPLRLPADRGLAAGRRLGREREAGGADLAAGGAESAEKTTEEGPALAERRLLRAAAAGAGEPCLVLRLRRGPHARRAEVPHALRRRRVHSGVAGDPGGPEAQLQRRDRGAGVELMLARGAPGHMRSDNGPEFVAKAVRDWIAAVGSTTAYIEPGSPWENGYCESFNAKLRDELLDGEIFYRAGRRPRPKSAPTHRPYGRTAWWPAPTRRTITETGSAFRGQPTPY